MNVLITGGTGFIGTALVRRLREDGHTIFVLTRDRARAERHFGDRTIRAVESLTELSDNEAPEAIVNLAGQSLGSGRWTESLKQTFVDSRVGTTHQVVEYIARTEAKPRVLVNGSAVGYYGARGDETLDEDSTPGNEFQAELCKAWEAEALRAQDFGVRVCLLRTGVVLGKGGGALKLMLPPFKFGLGGYVGDGTQWMPWIHLDDVVLIILHLINHDELNGPFNLTAPNLETNRNFSKKLGKALGRPVLFWTPSWALQLLVGEMAHVLLTGQKAEPKKLIESGYRFKYPELEQAFAEITGASSQSR